MQGLTERVALSVCRGGGVRLCGCVLGWCIDRVVC